MQLGDVASNLKKKKAMEDEIAMPQAAPVAAATEEAPAPEQAKNGKMDMLYQAIIGLAPALLGAAIGGSEGGASGAKAGKEGLDVLAAGEKESKADAKEKAKLAAEGKKEGDKLAFEKQKHADTIGLKKEENQIAATAASGKGSKEMTALAHTLRTERNSLPTTRATQEIASAYQKVSAAAEDPSAAGDLSLIFGYMKMLDPGSTVREGEFANAQNAAGVPEQVRNAWNKVKSGERLGDDQRGDFVNQAGNIWQSQQEVQAQVDNQYAGLATKYGLDPKDVAFDFSPAGTKEKISGAKDKRMASAPKGPENDQLASAMTKIMQGQSAQAAPSMKKEDLGKMSNEELKKFLGE